MTCQTSLWALVRHTPVRSMFLIQVIAMTAARHANHSCTCALITTWQVHERNSGRDPFPVFLKRGPLPREKPRGTSLTGRIPKSLCYRPEDFRLGGYVTVHNRDFLLHDCDTFTRDWYQVSEAQRAVCS